jgi:hypothetical protein
MSQAVLVPVVSASETSSEHVVNPSSVVDRLLASANSREERVALFERALSNPKVEKEASRMGLDAGKVRRAIPTLTDQELKDVAARARDSKDIVAGYYDDDGYVAVGVICLIAVTAVIVYLVDHPR